MIGALSIFIAAALLEIAGCFAFWLWLRRAGSGWWAAVGVLSLVGFALALTRVDATFAGRAYAAYGGVYIACALTWLWLIERQRPTMTDIAGVAVTLAGTLIIVLPALKR